MDKKKSKKEDEAFSKRKQAVLAIKIEMEKDMEGKGHEMSEKEDKKEMKKNGFPKRK